MANFDALIRELQQERTRLDTAISALSSLNGSAPTASPLGRRTMSLAARRKIAAAQRARWAKQKSAASAAPRASSQRRRISPAGLARIRAAVRARWAKVRAGKK